MADLDDILNGLDDEEEVEETETEESTDDGLGFLDDEEEAPLKPKKKRGKKKASKKKVSRKVEQEEEAPKPRRKKKVAKKVEVEPEATPEPTEAPKKRRGPKPGTKRKPRAPKAAAAGNDVLASLRDELAEIANGDSEKSRIAELKANIRTAKQLATQLERFSAKVEKAVAAQGATVEKLEAQLEKLTGE